MKLMITLADGFEEIEALAVIDILRRAGIQIDTVGVMGTVITSKYGVRIMVDKKLKEVNPDEYDGIVLPGGSPGYENLGKSSEVIKMLKNFSAQNKLIAAICGAPSILAKAGLLDGKKATIHPGMEKEIPYPRGERVVVDGKIITSQGAGTAIEFALKLVEVLAGRSKVAELKEHLVV